MTVTLLYKIVEMFPNARLQTTTAATSLSAGGVGGHGGGVLNAADLHASTGKSAESGLRTRTGGLGEGSSSSTELHMESGDSALLALLSDILCSQHSGVGRRLIAIGLHLHSSGDADDGFLARQISHVHESIVERSIDVGNTEHLLALLDLRAIGVALAIGELLGLLHLLLTLLNINFRIIFALTTKQKKRNKRRKGEKDKAQGKAKEINMSS